MNKQGIKLSFILLAVMMLTGAASAVTAQNARRNDLSSARWVLTEINDQAARGGRVFLEIDRRENRFSGHTGCNRMFGEALINGRRAAFSKIGTTKMFCDGRMQLESDVLAALKRVTRFEKNGGRLSLFAGNRIVLRFKAARDDESAVKLEDRKWMLEKIENRALPRLETTPFIVFDAARRGAGGDTGCNAFGGSYESAANGKIRIFEIVSTMRACIEDERMTIERNFKDALEKVDRFEIKGNKLNLYRNDRLLLAFRGESK